MPWLLTSAAATGSCVDSGLLAQRRNSAPPACRVMARLAVSVVMCRQPARRRPWSGFSSAKRSRISRRTGISWAAHSMRRWPSEARPRSATSCAMTLGMSVQSLLEADQRDVGPVAEQPAAAQRLQLDEERDAGHLPAQLLDERHRGRGGPAGGQQVVDDEDALTAPQRVGVDLQHALAVLQGVADAERLPRQLA